MCYPPSGYIIFSLRNLKSYGSWGPRAEGRRPDVRAGGQIEGRGQRPDNPNTLYLTYCFNFFRNPLWQHLISYNSLRNINMCLLEVAMCEKCRSSHFQSEGEFEDWGGVKKFWDWGGDYICWGWSVPHYMPWNPFIFQKN